MRERVQSLGEEIANSASHGVALLVAIAGVPYLIYGAWPLGVARLVGTAVFAAAMVLLYLTSTLYHALPIGRAKRVFLKLDHGAIYLFIAGSYTPFALGALGGPWVGRCSEWCGHLRPSASRLRRSIVCLIPGFLQGCI